MGIDFISVCRDRVLVKLNVGMSSVTFYQHISAITSFESQCKKIKIFRGNYAKIQNPAGLNFKVLFKILFFPVSVRGKMSRTCLA